MGPLADREYDVTRIVVRPLYFGLFVNILIPAAGLFICYYINSNHPLANQLGDYANALFYLFCVLAVGEGAFALWWRYKLFRQPMVRREETLESDLLSGLMNRSRPIFLLIAAISVYGYVYFLLTGRFLEAVLFVLFSFVVFQIVRPRHGQVRRLIEYQRRLLSQGDSGSGVIE